jgi:hypothetical protein
MSKLLSKKFLMAIIAVAAIVAISLGVAPSTITEIATALVALIAAVHIIVQGNVDAATVIKAANAAESIVASVAPNSPIAKIPESTIENTINTASDVATTVSDAISEAINTADTVSK